MIVKKYGVQRRGWSSEEVRGPYGVCLWKNILGMIGCISPTLFPSRLGMDLHLLLA
jgi:hypothetical protein